MGGGNLDRRLAGDAGRASVKILLVCPYDWEAAGGVQVHVRQLAAELRTRGHRTTILAPGSRPSEDAGVRIVGRPVRVPYRGTVAPISFSPGAWRRIRSAMRSFDPDLIHAHEPLTPSTSMLAVLAAEAPVVATFHASLDRSRLMELAGPALRQVSARIDAAVAVSDAAASFVRRVVRGPLEIVPNGVDVRAFSDPGRPVEGLPAGPKILWVNRLDPQKGFEIMLRAFEQIASEVGEVHLLVAGDGRDRVLLRSLPGDLRSRILRLGTVAHEALPRYHAAADVFVSPATGQESFGIVLVEAMAAGVPVVASDIEGYREVVRDGVDGLLAPPNDPNALAAAIRRVLSEPELAAALKAAGRSRAQAFSWQAVAPRLEAVYDRVLSARR
jgi:phosphatidylinositol alpha-mannosyltransferase